MKMVWNVWHPSSYSEHAQLQDSEEENGINICMQIKHYATIK